MSLRDRAKSPLDVNVGYMNVLLYGLSGNGKTTCASTAPGNTIYLASEPQGKKSVQEQFDLDIENGRDPDSLLIVDVEEKRDEHGKIVRTKVQDLSDILTGLERNPEGFTSLVLDSLSDVQASHVSSIEQRKGQMQIQDWGTVIRYTRTLAVRLRDLKMHTFVITLADEKQDEQNRLMYRPALKGKTLPNDLPQYFNMVTYIDKVWPDGAKEEKFIARMRSSSSSYVTKCPRVLDAIERPNIGIWMDKISKGRADKGRAVLPDESEVTNTDEPEVNSEDLKINERLKNGKTMKLFSELCEYMEIKDEKKVQTLKKYKSDEKLWEVLANQIEKAKKKADKANKDSK